jgi:hypothetical protein
VLIEKKMKLIEGMTNDLPMMLLVEVAQGDGVGEDLIEIFRAFGAERFIESDGELGDFSIGLNFARVLVKNGAGTFSPGMMIDL